MTAISVAQSLLLGIAVMNNNFLRDTCHSLGLTNTPLVNVKRYCPSGNMFVKCEGNTKFGSIKARCAFYMLQDAVQKYSIKGQSINIVESSSGNLAIALHKLSHHFDTSFLCLSDETIPVSKQRALQEEGVNVRFVQKGAYPDFRSARIAEASRLGGQPDYYWVNQYANLANAKAHYETTGPEIWEQTEGAVRWVVVSVGSAGTMCGIGKFLKQVDPAVNVVGVEPLGSTSFGGCIHPYVAAGSGMLGPSDLLRRYANCVDYFAQVSDTRAALECKRFEELEGFNVGLTTGHNLAIGSLISSRTKSPVVVISADSGKHYEESIKQLLELAPRQPDEVTLKQYLGTQE